jgi:hypothetical protein
MKEILRTTDVVLLSFAQHVLAEAGIQSAVFDSNMSIAEGSIGVLIPRRLMVAEDGNFTRAQSALAEAGLESALYREA